MSEIITSDNKNIGEVNIIEEQEETYKYIGVVFEDKYNPGHFRGNTYNYKTTKDLKEGQVLTVETPYGFNKVCVTKLNVNPDEINFDLDKIKEI